MSEINSTETPGCMALIEVLDAAARMEASDIHLGESTQARVRCAGRLRLLLVEPWHAQQFELLIEALCSAEQRKIMAEHHAVDLAFAHPNGNRYRLNIYRERGRWAMAARLLPMGVKTLASMNLPPELAQLAAYHSGLVLVTGSTGSGKSTTLAVLLDIINRERDCHILTIEDPVEYVHQNIRAFVHQRELHADAFSYASAVRSALRQDPDVMLIGEMRDLETMRSAMSAAETGHLVFSTLHTNDAVGALNRIIGGFPAAEQSLVRQQLSLVLKAVVTQRLMPNCDYSRRYPALEILLINPAVANLIRNNKPEQIYSVMESSRAEGMQSLEQSLAQLVNKQLITEEQALSQANRPEAMMRYLKSVPEAKESRAMVSKWGMTFEPH